MRRAGHCVGEATVQGHAGWHLQKKPTVPPGRGEGPSAPPARQNPRMRLRVGATPMPEKGGGGAVSQRHSHATETVQPAGRRRAGVRRGTSGPRPSLTTPWSHKSRVTPAHRPERGPQLRTTRSVAPHGQSTSRPTGAHYAQRGQRETATPPGTCPLTSSDGERVGPQAGPHPLGPTWVRWAECTYTCQHTGLCQLDRGQRPHPHLTAPGPLYYATCICPVPRPS